MTRSIDKLLERLAKLESAVEAAREEARVARAEAKAARMENGNGHTIAAVKNDPISRRSLLTKAAVVGAAGLAGSLLINRPKDVFASFTWTGGVTNVADAITNIQAGASFPSVRLLQLDTNQAVNTTQNIDGLNTFGANAFSGVAAYGGNKGGNAYYGLGGPAVTTGNQGPGITAYGGGMNSGGGGNGTSVAAWLQATGAADGTAYGGGANIFAHGKGYGLWVIGGHGSVATPHVSGGPAIFAYGGPEATAVYALGDASNLNPTSAAHGVNGSGNALGVGGYFSGGRAQVQIIPNAGVGAPTTGIHYIGDLYMDAHEVIWVCMTDGVTPGTFTPLQPGGMNNALFTAVSTQQYTFTGSNGATWVDMDATNLSLTITPAYNCQAIFTASADLWTGTVGFNQDIGVSISGGVYPTTAGQPEGWKESSGAAAFSPNAAHLDVIVPLAQGTTYTIKLVWKSNKPAAGKLIAAGAGPIGGKFSPSRLIAWLVPTNPGGSIPRKPEMPYAREVPALSSKSVDAYGRQRD